MYEIFRGYTLYLFLAYMKDRKASRFTALVASPTFFWIVLGFFVFEALWFVFSAVYPMAFDEDFHFGLIKLYSQHWLPFPTHQPTSASMYGPLSRDPSYLYHYLMSFPYRLIELFTKDQTIQIIWLRLINVALFSYSLVLFRQLLLRIKSSATFVNVSILVFVLIPIVPLLAATINYDNLFMIFVAWTGLLLAKIIPELEAKRVPLRDLGTLAIVCVLGSIVKYPFLPIFAACVLILVALSWRSFRQPRAMWQAVRKAFLATSKTTMAVLLTLLVLSLTLFSQRYVLNITTYKTLVPRCDAVLTVDACQSYGPWARDREDAQEKNDDFHAHILSFVPTWMYGMWYRLFFMINGNVPTPAWARYQNFAPLPGLGFTGIALAVVGAVLVLLSWRRLFRGEWLLAFFMLATMLYVAALFLSDYQSYANSGAPVAINGRYLLPLLLPLAAIAARAWKLVIGYRPNIQLAIACLVVLLFLQGGGVLSFMLDSNTTWYWPNHRVVTANEAAQAAAKKLVIFDKPLKIHSP